MLSTLSSILRLAMLAAFWTFAWQLIQPRTQAMRILRAGLLLAGFLVIWGALRLTGQ